MATGEFWLRILCLLLLQQPVAALATSIVAIVGERSVTIAADGVLVGKSVESGKVVRIPVCKIRCVDRLCFAASGRYNNQTIGYDLWQLVQPEISRAQTPKEASERFKLVIGPIIPKLVKVSKKETPQRYAEWVNGHPVLTYFFAGFDPKMYPVVASASVMLDREGHPLPIRESYRRSGGLVVLGYNQQIGDYIQSNPDWSVSATAHASDFAERMVRMEIQASEKSGRQDVGEPIAIVSLTITNGFHLEKKGACRQTVQ
jgi:hypothetical protein